MNNIEVIYCPSCGSMFSERAVDRAGTSLRDACGVWCHSCERDAFAETISYTGDDRRAATLADRWLCALVLDVFRQDIRSIFSSATRVLEEHAVRVACAKLIVTYRNKWSYATEGLMGVCSVVCDMGPVMRPTIQNVERIDSIKKSLIKILSDIPDVGQTDPADDDDVRCLALAVLDHMRKRRAELSESDFRKIWGDSELIERTKDV